MQDLMSDAVELMFLGMGVVFGFLTVLVIVTSWMSKMLRSVAPQAAPPKAPGPRPAKNEIEPQIAKAIQLAVNRYRKQH